MSNRSLELFNYILTNYPDQITKVFGQDNIVDIEPEFLGFIDIYYNLSQIIDKNYTVIDFGCGYNAQSFYFMEYKKYIGIDYWPDLVRFKAPGTEFHNMDINYYITNNINKFDINGTFAICSYVPNLDYDLIKHTFKNMFIFYPTAPNNIRIDI